MLYGVYCYGRDLIACLEDKTVVVWFLCLKNKPLFDSGGCLEALYLLFSSMNSTVKSLILLRSRLLISFFKNFKQQ